MLKVRNAIEAGALGIIIVDDGRCPEDEDEWMHSQKCIVGSVFKNGDGWASQDNPEAWAQTRIPTYFVTTNVGGNLTSVVRTGENCNNRNKIKCTCRWSIEYVFSRTVIMHVFVLQSFFGLGTRSR